MLDEILDGLADDEKLVFMYVLLKQQVSFQKLLTRFEIKKRRLYYIVNKLKSKDLIDINNVNNRIAEIVCNEKQTKNVQNILGFEQSLYKVRTSFEQTLNKSELPKPRLEKEENTLNNGDFEQTLNKNRTNFEQSLNTKNEQLSSKNTVEKQESQKHYHFPEHTPQKPYRYSKIKVYDDLVGCKIILNVVGWMWTHGKRAVLENLHKAWISAAGAKNTFSLSVIKNNINDLAFQNEKELIKQVREAFKKERKERTKEKKEKRDLDIYIQKPITNRLVINKIPFVIPNCLVSKEIDIIYNNLRVNNNIEYRFLRSLDIIKIFFKDRILTERIFKGSLNNESEYRTDESKVSKPKVDDNRNVQKSKTLSADNSLKSYLSKAFQGIKQEIEKNNQGGTVPDDFKSKLVLLLRQHFLKKHAAEMMFILKDLADKNNYLSFYQFLYDFISLKLLKRLQKANNPPAYLRNILKNTNISLEYHLWMNSQDVYNRSLKTEKVGFKIH